MTAPTKANARLQPGAGTQENTTNAADYAANAADNQSKKPEIDLASWAALGKHAKPRRLKASWRRGGAQ